MLVLGRKVNEQIAISDTIRITVLQIRGNQVRLGLEAPETVRIIRQELAVLGDSAVGSRAGTPAVAGPEASRRTEVEPPRHRLHQGPRRG